MKKLLSLFLVFTIVFTSLISVILTSNAGAAQAYVTKFEANFTEWTTTAGVTVNKTFTNPALTSNTMFITTAGTLDTNPSEYPQPTSTVEVVNKADLATTYPLVAADTGATAKLVKYTQNANIGMFRMRGAFTDLSAATKIRVTFKIFLTDICTKGLSYDTDGTTVLAPVKDTAGSVKSLNMSLIPQKGTSSAGSTKSFSVPVNQWYTVSQELSASAGANGVRLSIGTVSSASNYTCNFASTIFYDGKFKIEVLEDIVAPTDGEYTMLAKFNPGDATKTSASAGSGTALYSDNTVSYNASNGHTSEPSKQTDSQGNKFKTATSTLDTQINPSTLSSTDYPGIADTKVSDSGLIARLNRTAACSMIRFKDIIDTGHFAAGDRFKMKAWVYLADVYSRGEYETLADGVTIDKAAQKDTNATTAKIRFIYCTNTSSSNADGLMKTFTLETNKWHQIEISGTTSQVLNAVGIRIDQASDCYGASYAGSMFLGDIEMYRADKLPEINEGTNWQTVSNVTFETNVANTSNVKYVVDSTSNGSIQELNSLVATYPQAEVGTVGEKVFNFSMNNSSSSKFKINTIFDSTKIAAGDVVRVSALVFPASHTDSNAKTAKVRMFLADTQTAPIANDKKSSVNLKLDTWNKIAFTYTASASDITATQGVIIDADGASTFANTLLISDIKTEIYKAADAIPTNLNYTEDFEGYSSATQTHINTPHYRTFGTGGGNLAIGTTNSTLTGMVPASGTNALGIVGKGGRNVGIKVNDVFQGLPIEADVGKTFRISVKVYADKSKPLYKEAANSESENTTALTDAEKEQAKTTTFRLSYGGPDDQYYKYRTCDQSLKTTTVPYDTWTTISADLTITASMLDNGSTDTSAKTNPLVSSIRIDQSNAAGGIEDAICNTFYIDDLTISEVPPPQFTMPKVFGSNMVFQRNMPINIWGFATEDGKIITATLGTQTKTATSKDGKWAITFDPMDVARNLTLTVKSEGSEDIVFTNIAIGEVILAAGQSNMALTLNNAIKAGYEDAIAIKNDTSVMSDIRRLKMPTSGHLDLQTDVNVFWQVSASGSVTGYSAVGYVTAYHIAKEQNIPVGFIEACTGGLSIEAFMDLETLKSREMYKDYYINFYETQHASGINPSDWKYYPTGVYNTMLHPIKGMTVGSCVWYQGCNNRAMSANSYRPVADYEYLQYDFINMVRKHFNNEEMPFVICELANYTDIQQADLRQIQLNTAMRMDNVYLVSTSDVGSSNYDIEIENMIHPSNKAPVGKRAALCIMADKFGYEGEYTGPLYESMTVEGNKAILTFSHADGLKQVAKREGENTVTGFEISADGTNFVKATAEIGENNTVIVYADSITNPTTVRYCYTTFAYYDAEGNLCSGIGISESKFRTTYMPAGCENIGHLGGNLYNSADLPLGPFKATVIKPTVTSYKKETKDDKIHYTVDLKNTGFASGNPQVIAAVYTDGHLKYMKAFNTNFATQDIRTITDSFDASIVNADSELKFFLWDGFNNLRPFESAKILTFEE